MNSCNTKRTREVPPEVRQKISASLTGRKKSYSHRMHISQGVKRQWDTVPPSPKSGTTTMNDLI